MPYHHVYLIHCTKGLDWTASNNLLVISFHKPGRLKIHERFVISDFCVDHILSFMFIYIFSLYIK